MKKLTVAQYDTIVAISDFYQEIEDITLEYQEVSIAIAKLNWWRDQVIKMQEGKADHPIAIALQKNIRHFGLNALYFIEMIDGLEQNLMPALFPKFEDLVIHIMRTSGVRELLIAEVLLQKENRVASEIIYQFAVGIELINFLQNLRRYVRRGLIYFAEDELQRFQVTQEMLRDYKTTENIRKLLQFQAEKIERSFKKVTDELSPEAHQDFKIIMIRSKIALAILDAIRTSDFCVLENFIDITPWRCWWIVWRN